MKEYQSLIKQLRNMPKEKFKQNEYFLNEYYSNMVRYGHRILGRYRFKIEDKEDLLNEAILQFFIQYTPMEGYENETEESGVIAFFRYKLKCIIRDFNIHRNAQKRGTIFNSVGIDELYRQPFDSKSPEMQSHYKTSLEKIKPMMESHSEYRQDLISLWLMGDNEGIQEKYGENFSSKRSAIAATNGYVRLLRQKIEKSGLEKSDVI